MLTWIGDRIIPKKWIALAVHLPLEAVRRKAEREINVGRSWSPHRAEAA